MKKIFKFLLTSVLSLSLVPANNIFAEESNASNLEYYENFNVSFYDRIEEFDKILYGDVIDEEIVIYNVEKNVDNLDTYAYIATHKKDNITPLGWENQGNISSKSLNAIRYTFNNISWISRDGVWSLSLVPRSNYKSQYDITGVSRDELFNGIAIMFYNDYQWGRNQPSMRNQYICHWDYSNIVGKSTWNLEPSKPNKSYPAWVAGLCN